jgi:hypothetical protein
MAECAVQKRRGAMMKDTASRETAPHAFIKSVHGVRYQVKDVARSVAFYSQRLGITLQHQQLPAFANVSLGDAQILLSGPGASGSRPMPDRGSSRSPAAESCGVEGRRPSRVHRRIEKGRTSLS